jgi:hypothetical protein
VLVAFADVDYGNHLLAIIDVEQDAPVAHSAAIVSEWRMLQLKSA